MYACRFLLLIAWATSALASPSYCTRADPCLSLLKGPLKTTAVKFCSKYLGVRTTTSTSTVSITGTGKLVTTTLADETITQTDTTTITEQETQTDTVVLPNPVVTTTATLTAGTRTIYQKRDATARRRAEPVPSKLRTFAASRISSACSCLVTPSTSTSTVKTTTTIPGEDQTQTVQGKTETTTTTETERTTITGQTTKTVDPEGTDTVEILTTVTPILVKPKICNAKGIPNDNAFNYDANFHSNQAACIASCKTDNRCLSTAFYIVTDPSSGDQTGTCRKYDKSVTDSADLGSGINFNDKAC